MSEVDACVWAVVLNWKDEESTSRCLRSLLREPRIAGVVVVDNESEGELRAIATERVELIELDANTGFSRGVNVGIKRALQRGADAVFVINNDAELGEAGILPLLEAWHRDPDIGLLAPRVLDPDGTTQSTGGRFRALDASTTDLVTDGNLDYLTWACVLLPSRTIDNVGLLDEGFFMYWEDVDYGHRLKEAGLGMRVIGDTHVYHERSKSHSRAGAAIQRYSTHGLVYFCLKRGGMAAFVGMPYRIAGRLVTAGKYGLEQIRAVVQGARDGVYAFRRYRSRKR